MPGRGCWSQRWLVVFVLVVQIWAAAPALAQSLEQGFLQPPPQARPQTYWLWMNGNITADGITRDLEAMARAGIGGVMIFDGGLNIPKGPVDTLGPEWLRLAEHTIREAQRLGIEVTFHNGPGWSSSGGPWITPELSMQQLVWSEVTVQGPGRVEVLLPQPHRKEGYYRDAMVIAFPAVKGEEKPYAERAVRAWTGGGGAAKLSLVTDGDLNTGIRVGPNDPLTLDFGEPFEARSALLFSGARSRLGRVRIEISDDGVSFREAANLTMSPPRGIEFPGAAVWPPTRARYYRLRPANEGQLGEFWLYAGARIEDWNYKTNSAYRVTGPVRLPENIQREFAVDPNAVVDLTSRIDAQGRLVWEVPAGAWVVVRFGHTSTGQRNVAASDAGSGLECDKFSRRATELHFSQLLGRLAGIAGPLAGKVLVGGDVDSYEAELQNWTAELPQEFHRRNGYGILSYMPALTGRVVGDAARTERFLYDFRRTQADLMAENYYGALRELCHRHGMKLFVEGYGPGPFDELQVSGEADVPMAEFWIRTPWSPNRTVKSVASAAHVYGKRVVAAEAFTGEERTSRWLEYPYAAKTLGDYMFAQGINLFVFHRYAHQPHPTAVPGMSMGPWGIHLDRTATWFEQSRAWLRYLARCQFVLQQGVYVSDVLYFLGEQTPDSAQWNVPVLPEGYNYDLVNAAVLIHRAQAKEGRIVLPEGASYRLLVLPPDLKAMTAELARKLRELVESGAVVLGPKPEFSPTLKDYPDGESEMKSIADRLWGVNGESAGAKGRPVGRGRVFSGHTIADVLRQLGTAPDFTYTGKNPDAALSWQHRREGETDIYFVANRQRRPEEVTCRFRVQGKQPEIWDPETGTTRKAAVFAERDGGIELPLRLEPAGSVFVIFREPATGANPVGEVRRDNQVLAAARLEPAPPSEAGRIENTFTIALWAKPDVELRLMPRESATGRHDETGKHFLVPAPEGDTLYGEGRSAAGIAAGRNGVYVFERWRGGAPAVLVQNLPVAGWTHIAVVYEEGVPSLYVNGKFIKRGLRTGKRVHPGVGAPPPSPETTFYFEALSTLTRSAGRPDIPSQGLVYYFEGNRTEPQLFRRALTGAEIRTLAEAPLPAPPLPEGAELWRDANGRVRALAWSSGQYRISGGGTFETTVPPPLEVSGPWELTFQPDRGAPPSVLLDHLISWRLHPDEGVRYFSGTATYRRSVQIPAEAFGPGRRLFLDLGRVEVVAEVKVNGRNLGVLWKEPFRVEITQAARPGTNELEIEVTNLWANRLIGDEKLPAENQYHPEGRYILQLPEWYRNGEPKPPGGRVTFTTWRFYAAEEPLVESGLLGPVRLLSAVEGVFQP